MILNGSGETVDRHNALPEFTWLLIHLPSLPHADAVIKKTCDALKEV